MSEAASSYHVLSALRRGRPALVEEGPTAGMLVLPAESITYDLLRVLLGLPGGQLCVALPESRVLGSTVAAFRAASDMAQDATGADGGGAGTSEVDFLTLLSGIREIAHRDRVAREAVPRGVVPITTRSGGVLTRAAAAEAAVDLAELAGFRPLALMRRIDLESSRAHLSDLVPGHAIPSVDLNDLIRYRLATEVPPVSRAAQASLPTRFGTFSIIGYVDRHTGEEHVALVMGEVSGDSPVLVRMHTRSVAEDVFRAGGDGVVGQVETALARIADQGRGVLVYMQERLYTRLWRRSGVVRPEGGQPGATGADASPRLSAGGAFADIGPGAQILRDLGVRKLRVLTDHPTEFVGLAGFDLEITERLPLTVPELPERWRQRANSSQSYAEACRA